MSVVLQRVCTSGDHRRTCPLSPQLPATSDVSELSCIDHYDSGIELSDTLDTCFSDCRDIGIELCDMLDSMSCSSSSTDAELNEDGDVVVVR